MASSSAEGKAVSDEELAAFAKARTAFIAAMSTYGVKDAFQQGVLLGRMVLYVNAALKGLTGEDKTVKNVLSLDKTKKAFKLIVVKENGTWPTEDAAEDTAWDRLTAALEAYLDCVSSSAES